MVRNETGASSGFAPPFRLVASPPPDPRTPARPRRPPRRSRRTRARASRRRVRVARTRRARRVTREETPRRARRVHLAARARLRRRDHHAERGRVTAGCSKARISESPSCVPSADSCAVAPRRGEVRRRRRVREPRRELSARPESVLLDRRASPEVRARHARGRALGCRVGLPASTPTAPSDPSAARKSAPSRAGTAGRRTRGFGSIHAFANVPPNVSGEDGFEPPSARARGPRSRRALRGSGRHASQCAATSAGPPGRPRVRLHDHGLREAHRRIGRDALARGGSARGPHARRAIL